MVAELGLVVHSPHILYKEKKIFVIFLVIVFFVGYGKSKFEGKSLLLWVAFSSSAFLSMGLKVPNKTNEQHIFLVIKLLQSSRLDPPPKMLEDHE